MNAEMMANVVDVDLISDGVRYSLKVSKIQPTGAHTRIYTHMHTHTTLIVLSLLHSTIVPIQCMH